jgi:quinol monooxygenase YgiN
VHARSTTVQARPESIDAGIAEIRDEVMPMLQQMDGYIGLSMLVDRESGRCIVTTAWQDEDAMRASDAELRPVRERTSEMLGGRPQVEAWEIAVLHRDHSSGPGSCVRVTWVRGDPQQVDRAVDLYKTAVLPATQELEGFCSASMLVDRGSGRSVSSVNFDSRDAMDRTREQARSMRERRTAEAGLEVMEVAEFDLALAHLRVPEMA